MFNLRLGEHLGPAATIVCPPGSAVGLEAARAGIPVAELAFPAPDAWHLPALVAASLKLRQMIPPGAVVLAGAIRTALLSRLARLPNPTVILMHERVSASRPSVKLALRQRQAIVAVGSESAAAYIDSLPRAAVWAVNNFLSDARFEELNRVRNPASRGSSRPVLGVLARLVPEKGIDALVAELAHRTDTWDMLLIAGSAEDERHVRAIERAISLDGLQDRIRLLGESDDVPSFLSQLDALLVPSTGPEGQPTVILEGLAAGLPVIVRAPLASSDFADLPVLGYNDAEQLHERLRASPPPADQELLLARFGAKQVLSTLEDAVQHARASSKLVVGRRP